VSKEVIRRVKQSKVVQYHVKLIKTCTGFRGGTSSNCTSLHLWAASKHTNKHNNIFIIMPPISVRSFPASACTCDEWNPHDLPVDQVMELTKRNTRSNMIQQARLIQHTMEYGDGFSSAEEAATKQSVDEYLRYLYTQHRATCQKGKTGYGNEKVRSVEKCG
jgi:hypothetical protein